MYEVVLLNNVGRRFSKFFDSEYKLNNFIRKIKYSKKLKILSYGRI